MTEIWLPYGETKVFASLDIERIAFEQNLPEERRIEELKVMEGLMDKLSQYKTKELQIYYCTTNHPEIADFLGRFVTEFSSSSGKFEIRLIGPRGARIRRSLERLKRYRDFIRQADLKVHEERGASIYVGCVFPSFLFGVSGVGEAMLELEESPLSQETLEVLSRRDEDKLKTSLDLISSMGELAGGEDLLSVLFLPGVSGVSDVRIGNLKEVAKEVSALLKEAYQQQVLEVDGLVISLGGAPYDYSMSDSLDMMASAVQPNRDIEYGFVAEWKMGLGDERLLESFMKSVRDLESRILNGFNWYDLMAYALKSGELLRGHHIVTTLPQTLLKRTIGCKQCETANKLIQRTLRSIGNGKMGIIKSIPSALVTGSKLEM